MKDTIMIIVIEQGVMYDTPLIMSRQKYNDEWLKTVENNDSMDIDYHVYNMSELLEKTNYI